MKKTPADLFHPDLDRLLPIARKAAAAINEVVANHDLGVEDKADDQGPVTKADLAADVLIRAELAQAFVGDAIVTEETWITGSEIAAGPRVWFVDPLDGTQELINGSGDYAVMIGLAVDGVPELGVVCQPTTGKLWAGCVSAKLCFSAHEPDGPDATKLAGEARKRISVQDRAPPEVARLAISRSHKGALAKMAEEELGARAVEKGSVGLKVGLILDDEADLYLSGSTRIKVWDSCGPVAILRAAGGVIEAVDGSALTYVGAAAHGHGLRAFPPLIGKRWAPRIDAAVSRWRERA